jgi:hypothetical protein
MPECKFGINDKIVVESKGKKIRIQGRTSIEILYKLPERLI